MEINIQSSEELGAAIKLFGIDRCVRGTTPYFKPIWKPFETELVDSVLKVYKDDPDYLSTLMDMNLKLELSENSIYKIFHAVTPYNLLGLRHLCDYIYTHNLPVYGWLKPYLLDEIESLLYATKSDENWDYWIHSYSQILHLYGLHKIKLLSETTYSVDHDTPWHLLESNSSVGMCEKVCNLVSAFSRTFKSQYINDPHQVYFYLENMELYYMLKDKISTI